MTLRGLGVDAGTMRFGAVEIMQTGQVAVELVWHSCPGDPARSRVIFVPLEEFEREVTETLGKARALTELTANRRMTHEGREREEDHESS